MIKGIHNFEEKKLRFDKYFKTEICYSLPSALGYDEGNVTDGRRQCFRFCRLTLATGELSKKHNTVTDASDQRNTISFSIYG